MQCGTLLEYLQTTLDGHLDVSDHQLGGVFFFNSLLELQSISYHCNNLNSELIPVEHGLQSDQDQWFIIGYDQFGRHAFPSFFCSGRRMIALVYSPFFALQGEPVVAPKHIFNPFCHVLDSNFCEHPPLVRGGFAGVEGCINHGLVHSHAVIGDDEDKRFFLTRASMVTVPPSPSFGSIPWKIAFSTSGCKVKRGMPIA